MASPSPSPFTSLKPLTPFHLHPSLQHRSNRFPMEFARNAVLAPCSALSPPPCLFLRPAALRFRGGRRLLAAAAASPEKDEFGGKNRLGMANSNYVVPLDVPTPGLVRPLAEILRDLNRRVSEKIISPGNNSVPWYHANRMLSFYAPGWCGEVRDVIFSDDRSVTVVYRVTIRGSDGEAHRESTGTVSLRDNQLEDPVTAAEELAFCRACARFGFGLHLYHED